MCTVEGAYKKAKHYWGDDERSDHQRWVKEAKYKYLKKKLEYLTQCKYDGYYDRITFGVVRWGMSIEQEELLKNKMINDTELVQLRRTVKILKLTLLNQGSNKIYL